MLQYINPDTMPVAEIAEYLDEVIETMHDRQIEAHVTGRAVVDPRDVLEVVIDHAERVMPVARVHRRLLELGRYGRKTGIRLHLVCDRPLDRLQLADFGTPQLRAIAADGRTVAVIDGATGATFAGDAATT